MIGFRSAKANAVLEKKLASSEMKRAVHHIEEVGLSPKAKEMIEILGSPDSARSQWCRDYIETLILLGVDIASATKACWILVVKTPAADRDTKLFNFSPISIAAETRDTIQEMVAKENKS